MEQGSSSSPALSRVFCATGAQPTGAIHSVLVSAGEEPSLPGTEEAWEHRDYILYWQVVDLNPTWPQGPHT